MSSVTEAPRWRHEARAARTEPQQLLSSRLGRLELVSADASQLCFSGRPRPLAPAILSPLLCAFAGLPWLAPLPRTALHVATSVAFGLAAGCLVAWAWPRRRHVRVISSDRASSDRASSDRASGDRAAGDRASEGALAGGTVSGDEALRGTHAVQPGTIRWVLDLAGPDGAAPAGYTAALRTSDGAEHVVLENTDPERLLRQLGEVLRHWPGPVECRWGLPASARPWSIEPESGPRALATTPALPVLHSPLAPRPLVWCTSIMAVLVIIDLVLLVVSAGAKLPSIHPLSVILAFALGLYLVLLAIALFTGSDRLALAGRLRKERSLFGVTRVVGEVRPESVRGVYAVGAPDAPRWHVLVDSADGPLSVSVSRGEAETLARETQRALTRAPR